MFLDFFDKLDNNDLWKDLFITEHSQLINDSLLPIIIENIDLDKIINIIMKEINKFKLSKSILSRLKVFELLVFNKEYENKIIKLIIEKKYYREIYKCFSDSKEHIIRWTIITFFKDIYNKHKHPKIIKYYYLMKNNFDRK